MSDQFEINTLISASPEAVYEAWLSSEGHTAMTGASAEASPRVGAPHSAWDGYIWGETRELEPGKRIVQTWRTSEFAESDADSMIEIVLQPEAGATRLLLRHTNIPDGQGESYRRGWMDHYFEPMKAHFG